MTSASCKRTSATGRGSPRLTEPVLQVEDARTGYGELTILNGITLAIPKASWTTIIGANGAGKSTLLKLIAGLLPCRSGRVLHEGRDVTADPPLARLAGGIGLVPQGRCNFPALTVAENLKLGAYSRKLARAELAGEADAMAERFPRLKERWQTLAGNMSGGEQQLLEMAMVLMAKPRLLLLDEPSLGLSPQAMDGVFETIRRLTGNGITVLMVEQNAQQALERCDFGVVLELGQVSLYEPAKDVLGHPDIRRMFLGL
jgi:branched-chain amino acid transport system ATP-binding protein